VSADPLIAAPVRTFRPLSEEVYDVLRAAILSGRLPPGARIVEADIARQMTTSRSPVREAVRKLEREGLVEYKPRRGTVVVGLSYEDVADAYQLRAHLEAYAARLAAVRATDVQLNAMLELIERMRTHAAAQDLSGLLAADVAFHRLLCEAAGSRRLLQLWDSLNPERWTLLSGLRATGELSLEQLAERHWPILAVLQSRNPERADAIIRSHILELAARVLAGLAEDGEARA
jgi:DNA-binding GntR family transcriptional regulator